MEDVGLVFGGDNGNVLVTEETGSFKSKTGVFVNVVLGVDFQPDGDVGALRPKPDV